MRTLVAAALLALALATGGCTIAGTAVGARIPRYERTDWRESRVELGSPVRVHVRSVGSDAYVMTRIDGRYGGVRNGLLSVTDERGREHELAVSDVSELEVRRGSEWAKGLLIGAAADTIAVFAVVAIANGAEIAIATDR